jgi:hypothetical protein
MKKKTSKQLVLAGLVTLCIMLSGCVTGGQGSPSPQSATAIPTLPGTMPTQIPEGSKPASNSGITPADTPGPTTAPGNPSPTATPGSPGSNQTSPISGSPTPLPTQAPGNNTSTVTPTPTAAPSPSTTPQPVLSGQTSNWGTDKNTYGRGSTMTGWVDVTNTGNVPITEIDFKIVMTRTDFPIAKTDKYNSQGLNIQPGQTQRITFSEIIPATYDGISTAGNYRLAATANLAGQNIGSYSKGITIN